MRPPLEELKESSENESDQDQEKKEQEQEEGQEEELLAVDDSKIVQDSAKESSCHSSQYTPQPEPEEDKIDTVKR